MPNTDNGLLDPQPLTGTLLQRWGIDKLLLHTEAALHFAEFPMGAMPW